ncbi:MAG TPA: prolyl oligopeptidase family serine peptidase [Leptolyngbyaceae cyanobacterium]
MLSTQIPITRTESYDYLLFLPKQYDTRGKWPLILFLHGSGERGSNVNDVKRHGVAKIVENKPEFPFIVVSPQCPRGQYWSVPLLNTLLDEAIAAYNVNLERIYLTGLSMGGYGTWRLAAAQPDRFAAIAPVCGRGNPMDAYKLKDLPIWVFHGAIDTAVPFSESEKMVTALKDCGGNVKFTVYPETGHDSWTETYANPGLYDWFLQHNRTLSVF